jgi:hypothetical protein
VLSHGPLLSELARLEEQVACHLDTIDRAADLIASLQDALAKRLPAGIQSTDG